MTQHTCDFCDAPATHSQTEQFTNEFGQQAQHTERQCGVHFNEHYAPAPEFEAVKAGFKTFKNDGSTWYGWAVVAVPPDVDLLDEDTIDAIFEAAFESKCMAPIHYHGAGQSFANEPALHVVGRRALVTQRMGYDV
jgi:hypothetical protein